MENSIHRHMEFYDGKNAPKIEWLSGNVIRVWSPEKQHPFKPGQYFRLLQYYYDAIAIRNCQSTDITLENIQIYSVPGFAFQNRENKNLQLLNCAVAPPSNAPQRMVTCTARYLWA